MKKSARQTAFDILLKVERGGAYSNLELDSRLGNISDGSADSALLTALVYGTLEKLITIDYNLSLCLRQPLKKLKPEVLTALRLGTYQLLFMDRIPQSAAVNESVKLVKNNNSAFASGLVNAVLRKIGQNGLKLSESDDAVFDMSIRFSLPEWFVKMCINAYGMQTAYGLMESLSCRAPMIIRVNTEKCTSEELAETLRHDGVETKAVCGAEHALELLNPGAVERLDAYRNGLFHVQDLSSQLCCAELAPMEDERVFDLCAAPGGKSFTLAQMMKRKGELLSCDIYDSRLGLIANGAERLGLSNIKTVKNDASVFNADFGTADKVLCDVPCSGLGIIRRKPEIRYKNPSDIDKLPPMQYHILCCGSRYVKAGGKLVYSTCSLNPAENAEVCDRFLDEHPDFVAVRPLPELKERFESDKYLTLMPNINKTDGFFIASFIRTE